MSMKPSEVERWAVREIVALQNGTRHEDDRVEIKVQPKPNALENARRIAGHANKSGQDKILWIFGLDDNGKAHPVDACYLDPANWWPAVAACFDREVPTPTFATVESAPGVHHPVVGFDTDAIPFVIRLKPNGTGATEIPWREGTSTRSATRSEILRLLATRAETPTLELVDGRLVLEDRSDRNKSDRRFRVGARIFVKTNTPAVIPDHLLQATVTIGDDDAYAVDLKPFTNQHYKPNPQVERGTAELVVTGPVVAYFEGWTEPLDGHEPKEDPTSVEIVLQGDHTTRLTWRLVDEEVVPENFVNPSGKNPFRPRGATARVERAWTLVDTATDPAAP